MEVHETDLNISTKNKKVFNPFQHCTLHFYTCLYVPKGVLKLKVVEGLDTISNLTCPISQPGHPWFLLVEALVVLLDQTGSAIPLTRLGALASPRLVLVVWVVFLVLQSQPVSLLNEGALLSLREKSEEKRQGGVEGEGRLCSSDAF